MIEIYLKKWVAMVLSISMVRSSKVDYWKQDLYRVVQTILWTKGKSKLSPVAIVAEDLI